MSALGRLRFSGSMMLARAMLLRLALASAVRPKETQDEALRRIVVANADTEFGREHGFARIRGVGDWRQAVPVRAYEDLRPWIERQAESGLPCLTADAPVMYNLTSGTTAKPKLIPVTRRGFARIRREQWLFACAMDGFDGGIFAGRIAGIASPAVEGHLPNGVPFGSVSGRIYREMPASARARYVLPPEVFEIADYEARYRVIAAFLLAAADISVASTANPSTFLRLVSVIDAEFRALLEWIARGRLELPSGTSPSVRAALDARFRADPARVTDLRARASAGGPLGVAAIWPRLRALATWTGGSCGVALDALRAYLGPGVRIVELGYAASEFRGTVNVDPGRNLCLPTLRDIYFEFAEADAGATGPFLGLHELEEGGRYRVFATTPDGLYRYDINDVLTVAGRIGRTPALAFLQKGKGVTSITGEKLHESQVSDALAETAAAAGLLPLFYMALADEHAAEYRIYLEAEGADIDLVQFAHTLDAAIAERNREYREKRAGRRLAPMRMIRLRTGAADAYRRHCVAAGQRDSQFKVVPLRYAREVGFDLAAWAREA